MNLVENNSILFHNYYHHQNHRLQDHFQEDHHHQQYVKLVVQEVFYVLQFSFILNKKQKDNLSNYKKSYRLCSIFHSLISFINGRLDKGNDEELDNITGGVCPLFFSGGTSVTHDCCCCCFRARKIFDRLP